MTRFAEILKAGPRKPGRIVTLPTSAFAESAGDRPAAPVQIGLRLPSEQDFRRAQAEGSEREDELGPSADPDDRVRAFNSGVIVTLVAACSCLAMDATQPFFESYLEAEHRLTPDGLRLLWQALELLQVAENPSIPELTDEGMSHLWAIWERGEALAAMPDVEAKKIRRMLEWARQTLALAEEQADALGRTG